MGEVKLTFNEKFIEIGCNRNDTAAHEKIFERIPYVHFNRTRTKFKTTIKNIDLVLQEFRNIGSLQKLVDKGAPQQVVDLYKSEMERRKWTDFLIEDGPQQQSNWLFPHQELAREIAHVNKRFGFFYDTRTGKTPMSLQIMVDDIKKNPDHKWLVLCPLILIENAWLEDAEKFFPDLKVLSLHDKSKQKRLKRFKQDANIYVSNIESFVGYKEHIQNLPIHGCFIDESSTMKSHKAKFAKEAVKYTYSLPRLYLLSGSPAPNGEWEYYRQLQAIDYYGVHQSWTQFKEYFFENVSYNPQFEKLKAKPGRRNELLGLLRKRSLYVDKEDCLTTPGRDFIPHKIKMPDELKKHYDKMRNDLYLELGDDILITAPATAAKINKLNQISSGFVIDTESGETHLLSDYKFKELDRLLNENVMYREQVIIWANFKKEFEIIKEMYGSNCRIVNGTVSAAQKNQAIKDFKEGRAQYLVANPASADKGLTLTNTHIAIYFSLNHSYELWKQSTERIYGDISKQKHKCNYLILIADGTIDKVIYRSLQDKKDVSEEILNHLKGGF